MDNDYASQCADNLICSAAQASSTLGLGLGADILFWGCMAFIAVTLWKVLTDNL